VEAEVLRVEFVCGIGGDPLVVLEEVQQVGVLEGVELEEEFLEVVEVYELA
jgi:hypothetical protein